MYGTDNGVHSVESPVFTNPDEHWRAYLIDELVYSFLPSKRDTDAVRGAIEHRRVRRLLSFPSHLQACLIQHPGN